MNVSINEQTLIFLYSIVVGQGIGVVYDFFRAIRKTFKFKTINTFICDCIFWLISLTMFLLFILNFAGGEGRFYIIFAMILGIILYFLCISCLFIEIFSTIVWFCYFVFNKIFHAFTDTLKKVSKNIKKTF